MELGRKEKLVNLFTKEETDLSSCNGGYTANLSIKAGDHDIYMII